MNNYFLAVMSEHPGLVESITFLLTGFGLVILALFVLAGITRFVGICFSRWQIEPKQAKAPVHVLAGQTQGIDSETVAVITAAIYSVYGREVRLTQINRSGSDQVWSREGRKDIHSSHNVRGSSAQGRMTQNRPSGYSSRPPIP